MHTGFLILKKTVSYFHNIVENVNYKNLLGFFQSMGIQLFINRIKSIIFKLNILYIT